MFVILIVFIVIFQYGDIEILMVSSVKKGRGIVEFKTKDGAVIFTIKIFTVINICIVNEIQILMCFYF